VDRPVGAPGHGQGGHHRARRHHAEVDIPYSPTEFQIVYRSSWGLDYKDGKIHGNYNRWINRLRDNVLKELSFNPTSRRSTRWASSTRASTGRPT
jgi:hypothetical protein